MPKLTPRSVRPKAFTDVKVSERADARWTDEQLADRSAALAIERNAMPRVTDIEAGTRTRSSTPIAFVEDGWNETFDIVSDAPSGRYVEYDTNEFVGSPGASTILKTFHKEALRRGLVLGQQIWAKDSKNGLDRNQFRVVLNREANLDDNSSLLQVYQTMLSDGVEQDLIETE